MEILNKSPQQEGRQNEIRFAKKYNLEVVPGSGNQRFAKLDIKGKNILLSLKWTSKKSYSITLNDLQEIREAISAPGGLGLSTTGALVTNIEGREIISLDLNDLIRLLETDSTIFEPNKTDRKRATANVPSLFREVD